MRKPTGPWWSDPIGWSDSCAGTRRRVVICTISQAAFVVAGAVLLYKHIMIGFFPLVSGGVVLPYYFLSAMHELLQLIPREIRTEEPSVDDNRLGPTADDNTEEPATKRCSGSASVGQCWPLSSRRTNACSRRPASSIAWRTMDNGRG